jgi:hypothetical protein
VNFSAARNCEYDAKCTGKERRDHGDDYAGREVSHYIRALAWEE